MTRKPPADWFEICTNAEVAPIVKPVSLVPGVTTTSSTMPVPLSLVRVIAVGVARTPACTVTVKFTGSGVPPMRLLQAASEQARKRMRPV